MRECIPVAVVLMFLATPGGIYAQPSSTQTDAAPPIVLDAPSLGDFTPLDENKCWLTYNYRNPRVEPLLPAIQSLLGDRELTGNAQELNERVHFLAAVARGQEVQIAKIKALHEAAAETEKEILGRILSLALDYQEVPADSPANFRLIWATYQATGNPLLIRKLIDLLSAEATGESGKLAIEALESLMSNIPRHPETYGLVERYLQSSPNDPAGRLAQLWRHLANLKQRSDLKVVKGFNLLKVRETRNDGYRELREAQGIFTDYGIYRYVAQSLLQDRAYDKAQPFLLRSLDLLPQNGWTLMQVGNIYYLHQEYQKAIDHLERAIQADPELQAAIYTLSCAYCESGDRKKAIKVAAQYMKGKPTPGGRKSLKEFLAKYGIQYVEDQDNPMLMIQDRQYGRLNEHLARLLSQHKIDDEGWTELSGTLKRLTELSRDRIRVKEQFDEFTAWAKAEPDSHFANACLGLFLVKYAWNSRGSGVGSTVTDQGRTIFNERLQEAERLLEKAYGLEPNDPVVPASLITVAMGLGHNREQVEAQFQRALKADPSDYWAYNVMLTYLMPKWHGSRDEMFAFARYWAKNSPAGSMGPLVLAKAHWEMFTITKNPAYFRDQAVWTELKGVYSSLLESFPRSKELHNWMARSAFLSGDVTTALREIAIIGEEGMPSVWGSLTEYQDVRRSLLPPQSTPAAK